MTLQETSDELVSNFELFEDWEDRYRFLIDMGRALPPLDDALKTDSTKVHGCQSNVWLVADRRIDGTIDFIADSDSSIVRGLIAVLREVYAGRTPEEISRFDIEELFRRLGFDQHLSMGRRNGLNGMVERIRKLVAQDGAAKVL